MQLIFFRVSSAANSTYYSRYQSEFDTQLPHTVFHTYLLLQLERNLFPLCLPWALVHKFILTQRFTLTNTKDIIKYSHMQKFRIEFQRLKMDDIFKTYVRSL